MPPRDVTLVIPAKNAEGTLDACLSSVVPMLQGPHLAEILLVDDGSTDATAEIARRHPGVRCLPGEGKGPGSARNLGFRASTTPLIWFVDSDCVAEPDALDVLHAHMDDPGVVGVSGSYGNMRPDSLLASLINEEIVERHLRMPTEVNFLATFNVLYRREALLQAGGFDERFLKAQDAELSFRMRRIGRLHLDVRSRVKHFHESRLREYLDVQRKQGYWRMWLYAEHPDKLAGDSYSGTLDHIQPVLAVASLSVLPLGPLALAALPATLALGAATLPMTTRLVKRTHDPRYLMYAPMSFVRAYARGLGLLTGTLSVARQRLRRPFDAGERAG